MSLTIICQIIARTFLFFLSAANKLRFKNGRELPTGTFFWLRSRDPQTRSKSVLNFPVLIKFFGQGSVLGFNRNALSWTNRYWFVNPWSEGPLDGADGLECCNNDLDNPVYDDLSEDDKELIRQKSKNLNVRASADPCFLDSIAGGLHL